MVRRASFRVSLVLALLVVAALTSACSGGSGGTAAGLQGAPSTNSASTNGRRAATIVVKIPAGTKLAVASKGRAPQYVSPATLSAGFLVYPAGSSPTTGIIGYADLSATSPLCTVAGDGSRFCTFSIQAPVGNDTFVMTLFDEALAGGVVPSGANQLSTNTVDYVVSPDTVNPLTFDLQGIPASVVLNPLSMSVAPGPMTSYSIFVIARDADDYIIGGNFPYAQPIQLAITNDPGQTMSFNSTSYVPTISVTNPGANVTLYYNGQAFSGTISLTASEGSIPPTTMQITPATGTGTVGVTVPAFPTKGIVTSSSGAFSGFAANTIGNVAPAFTRTSSTQPGTTNFLALANDAGGNLYTIDGYYTTVAEFAAPFASGSHSASPTRTIAMPGGYYLYNSTALAVDSYSNVYVAAQNTNGTWSVVEFAAGTSGTPARILGSTSSTFDPAGLALDASNDLYVADSGNNAIEEYAPGASGTPAPLATIAGGNTGLSNLAGIAVDPAGNVFAAAGHSVNVFGVGRTGNVAPTRSFLMDGCSLPTKTQQNSQANRRTPLTAVTPYAQIAVDVLDNVYAAGVGQVCIYAPNAQGDAQPIDVITGSNTGLGTASGTGIVVEPGL